MINTEHIIKRRVVSDGVYYEDSDDDINSERNKVDQRRRKHRRKYADPKYYDNDSDFDSPDEQEEKQSGPPRRMLSKQSSFDKKDVAHSSLMANKSGLSAALIKSPVLAADTVHIGRSARGSLKGADFERSFDNDMFYSFKLTVWFGEYLDEDAIKLDVAGPWSVKETTTKAIALWRSERAMLPLKGHSASQYAMRGMDGDELEYDVPAFANHLKIHGINERNVGLEFLESAEPVIPAAESSSVIQFKTQSEHILVKISIPGPNNESHVLAIDKDSTATTVRDLISLLNKKKRGAHFHPEYFSFFFREQTKAKEVPLAKNILDLDDPRELMLLPKFLGAQDDIDEAYGFYLVKLANEKREFQCVKIRSTRKNQKRKLIVDRHRIQKKALEYGIGGNDHAPIEVTSIVDCSLSDKNKNQFTIDYRKPGGGKRNQTYELENDKECKEIVNKIRFLMTLRRLQG